MGTFHSHSRHIFILLLSCLILNGCATTQYGNFIQNASIDASQAMANDAAAQIGRLYPAASTQLNLNHVVNDPFGHTLVDKLRQSGFAVLETVNEPISILPLSLPEASAQSLPQQGLTFGYVVDQSDELYHANVHIGDRHLSRAFLVKDNAIYPAGHWVSRQ